MGKVLTRDVRGKKERERERERERKRGRTEAMCVICCGPVCVPLGYLLPFLLAWFHQRGYFVWFKEEWVSSAKCPSVLFSPFLLLLTQLHALSSSLSGHVSLLEKAN